MAKKKKLALFLVTASLASIFLWFYIRPSVVREWCRRKVDNYWLEEREKGRVFDQEMIETMNEIGQECEDRFGVKRKFPVMRMRN